MMMSNRTIAELIYNAYYHSEHISDYESKEPDVSLEDVLWEDIRDLLHNGNLEDLFPTLGVEQREELAGYLYSGHMTNNDPLIEVTDLLAARMRENNPA